MPTLLLYDKPFEVASWENELAFNLSLLGWNVVRTPRDYTNPAREQELIVALAKSVNASVFVKNNFWTQGPTLAALDAYRAAGMLTVGICQDEPYRWSGYDNMAAKQAPGYDLWFGNWDDPEHLACHTAGRVVYAPCATRRAFMPRPMARTIPVGHIGVYYEAREPYLAAVADLGIVAWMTPRRSPPFHQWPPPPSIAATLAPDEGYMHPHRLAQVCSSFQIGIDIAEQPDGKVRSAKNFLFEMMACGTFVLAGRCRQSEELFRDGEHLVFYDDAADLRAKVIYWQAHPHERQEIAANGARLVHRRDTWMHRTELFSRVILQQLKGDLPDGVAVVIPTMNRPEQLSHAIVSIPYGVTLSIVNTGRSDAWHHRMIVSPGSGPSKARNAGVRCLQKGSSEWIQFLDDDDLLRVDWAEHIRRGIASGADVILGSGVSYDPEHPVMSAEEPFTSQMCVRRSMFEKVGGFDESLTVAEERDLLRRMVAAGASVYRSDMLVVTKSPHLAGARPAKRRIRF
jgi:hypothetical protein